MQAQRWSCVSSAPCSESLALCSGTGQNSKRAKLTGTGLLPNKDTYIFECLIDQIKGPLCTTGSQATDTRLLGTSLLSELKIIYNYQIKGMYTAQGTPLTLGAPIQSDNLGTVGPLEWESETPGQRVGRMFVAMNDFDPKTLQKEGITSQKQAVFELEQLPHTSCLMITWDPEGTVFDVKSKKPIEGATITLLQKQKDGSFTKLHGSEVLGGLQNPVVTGPDGRYSFRVPDGVYKLKIEKDGYQILTNIEDAKNYLPYTGIYTGGEIVEEGNMTHADIPMKKVTASYLEFIWNLLSR